jgi:hypothetical protein
MGEKIGRTEEAPLAEETGYIYDDDLNKHRVVLDHLSLKEKLKPRVWPWICTGRAIAFQSIVELPYFCEEDDAHLPDKQS